MTAALYLSIRYDVTMTWIKFGNMMIPLFLRAYQIIDIIKELLVLPIELPIEKMNYLFIAEHLYTIFYFNIDLSLYIYPFRP